MNQINILPQSSELVSNLLHAATFQTIRQGLETILNLPNEMANASGSFQMLSMRYALTFNYMRNGALIVGSIFATHVTELQVSAFSFSIYGCDCDIIRA